MKKKTSKRTLTLPEFENGQVWQMSDSSLLIGLVGKTLVHYKHYRLAVKRPPVQLSGKRVLEQFLQQHEAVLLPSPALPAAVAGKGSRSAGKSCRPAKNGRTVMAKPEPMGVD